MSTDVSAGSERKSGARKEGGTVKSPSSPRRRAREFIVQGLYQWLVGGQDFAAITRQASEVAGFSRIDTGLYEGLLDETMQHVEELKLDLAPHTDRNWDEISPIERSILLLGACELKHHLETPYRVVINEGIELAKTYGGTDGHKFVNGVLDKLAAQTRSAEFGKSSRKS